MHSQGEPHCPALGSLCPPPLARMALLRFLVCFLLFALLLGAGVATIPVPAQWGGEQGLLPSGGACPLPLLHVPQPRDSVQAQQPVGGVPRGDY